MINVEKSLKPVNIFNKIKLFNYHDFINVLVIVIGIVISVVEIIELRNTFKIFDLKFIIYNIIMCLMITILNVRQILDRRKMRKEIIHSRIIEERNKNLLEITDNVRSFKHDFNNIIQAINGYIDLKDMNALQKYFNSLTKDCHHINLIEILDFQVMDNPAIYSVLLNKYEVARENNITMNIDVMIKLDKFSEKSYVLSRMLGILLDNALEASNECEEKVINIQFLKDEKRNTYVIIIENTYINKNVDTHKIFEKNYTTKKDKGNSGLGLWKINDIIEKDSKLELFTNKDEKMFKQKIEIYK